MKDILIQTLVTSMYFVALINPISKVSVLAVLSTENENTDFRRVAMKASFTAACILLGSMVFGDFLLRAVFHVELHALRLAGGAVLWWVGFNALRKGVFFEQETRMRFEDVALVPLACPMIAGPASIAAAIAVRARDGFLVPAMAILIAVGMNHIGMVFSRQISHALGRFNLLGAIVRLTGLMVMTIGIQMSLDGIAAWWAGI